MKSSRELSSGSAREYATCSGPCCTPGHGHGRSSSLAVLAVWCCLQALCEGGGAGAGVIFHSPQSGEVVSGRSFVIEVEVRAISAGHCHAVFSFVAGALRLSLR